MELNLFIENAVAQILRERGVYPKEVFGRVMLFGSCLIHQSLSEELSKYISQNIDSAFTDWAPGMILTRISIDLYSETSCEGSSIESYLITFQKTNANSNTEELEMKTVLSKLASISAWMPIPRSSCKAFRFRLFGPIPATTNEGNLFWTEQKHSTITNTNNNEQTIQQSVCTMIGSVSIGAIRMEFSAITKI